MIVDFLTPQTVAAGIKGMCAGTGGMAHLARRRKFVDRYQGVGIDDDVRVLFDPNLLAQITVDTLPVAAKVIDARYSVYREAPVRSYSREFEKDVLGNLDSVLPVFERITGLLGTEAVIVTVDEDERKLSLVLLTEFEPIFVGADPEPVGIAYPIFANKKLEAKDQEWECWTADARFRVSGAGAALPPENEQDSINAYRMLPIVVAHRGLQLGTSWWRPEAKDVIDAQLTYNVLGTQHNAGLLFQALGQPVATGITEADAIKTGVNRVVSIRDPQGRFEVVAPPGNLAQIMDAQRWKLDSLCFKYGIKAKWAADGGATSGEHQRLLEIELSNAVGSDHAAWLHFERELHDVMRAVAKAHDLGDLGELTGVDFAEPNVPLSDQELRDRWEFEYKNGLATKGDYFKLSNPDISDEDIAARLQAVADERRADPTAPAVREPGLADILNGTA